MRFQKRPQSLRNASFPYNVALANISFTTQWLLRSVTNLYSLLYRFTNCCQRASFNKIAAQQVMLIYHRQRGLSALTASLAAVLTIGQFKHVDTPVTAHQKVHSRNLSSDESHKNSSQAMSAAISEQLQRAKEGALWGMMIADALAMPVHWFYNPDDIRRSYGGWLTGYTAACKKHPSSILSLSATDGSGRNGWHSKSKPLIGSVILHDKLKFWQGDRSTHYHQGMKAGENTLNSVTARLFMKTMQRVDAGHRMPFQELRGLVLEDYVKFMTTPGSHNDTYAESFHRSFFRDWASQEKQLRSAAELLDFTKQRYIEKSKGPGDSQLVVIGALAPAIPWILHTAHQPEDVCAKQTIEFIKCTHPVPALVAFIDLYSRLLHGVLNGRDLKQEVLRVLSHSELGGPQKRELVLGLLDRAAGLPKGSEQRLKLYQRATQTLGSACYIEGALSSLLFLAYEFADDFEGGVLANANCGGENCHRGAALGALLGAHAANTGKPIPQHLREGLTARQEMAAILNNKNHL